MDSSPKKTDIESIVLINDERTDQKNISEYISPHQNSTETIDHTFDDKGINLVNTK